MSALNKFYRDVLKVDNVYFKFNYDTNEIEIVPNNKVLKFRTEEKKKPKDYSNYNNNYNYD